MDIASKPGGFNSLGGDKPKPVWHGLLFRPFGSGDGLLLPVCDEDETEFARIPISRHRKPMNGKAMMGKASICRRLGLLGPET
jgi:hypothetical protein